MGSHVGSHVFFLLCYELDELIPCRRDGVVVDSRFGLLHLHLLPLIPLQVALRRSSCLSHIAYNEINQSIN